jgi:hypothetical protein
MPLVAALLLMISGAAHADMTADVDTIRWISINNGGLLAASENYQAGISVGAIAPGDIDSIGKSSNYWTILGFWQTDIEADCYVDVGNANGQSGVDIDDVVYLIAYIFQGGPPPVPYTVASGDATCDCQVDNDDVVYLIAYIYSGGPPPCECEEWLDNCGWIRK